MRKNDNSWKLEHYDNLLIKLYSASVKQINTLFQPYTAAYPVVKSIYDVELMTPIQAMPGKKTVTLYVVPQNALKVHSNSRRFKVRNSPKIPDVKHAVIYVHATGFFRYTFLKTAWKQATGPFPRITSSNKISRISGPYRWLPHSRSGDSTSKTFGYSQRWSKGYRTCRIYGTVSRRGWSLPSVSHEHRMSYCPNSSKHSRFPG